MKIKFGDLEITKDGTIQGWAVSLTWTLVTLILLILGFFVDKIAAGWKSIGPTYIPIFLGSQATWLTYRYLKHRVDVQTTSFNYNTSVDAAAEQRRREREEAK